MADATAESGQAVAGPYDLLIVTDATLSMGKYLESLTQSLPEIIRISALTGCFARVGVVAYRDYCDDKLAEWSGWHGIDKGEEGEKHKDKTISREELFRFVAQLKPDGGGDWPEAAKTGLAEAYSHMRTEAKTVMLFYADAPPHTAATGGENRGSERLALRKADSYGGTGHLFMDWINAAHTLRAGPKMCKVFCIIGNELVDTLAPFVLLSSRTRGTCIKIPEEKTSFPAVISELSVGILLAWMGFEKEQSKMLGKSAVISEAIVCRYKDKKNLADVKAETDESSQPFMVYRDTKPLCAKVAANIDQTAVPLASLKKHVHTRPAIEDFSKQYLADPAYRALVVDQLSEIIANDVAAIAVNPIFGSLWRTVCNDRGNEARDKLVQSFGAAVDKIADPERKKHMREWLEASYDYEAEILELIEAVPEAERFPCVYLDPTIDFTKKPAPAPPTATDAGAASEEHEVEQAEEAAAFKFTRDELLEIGRSCDPRILRRLGRVLTSLTYVESKDRLPAHIGSVSEKNVPRIPMALADAKHKRKFWKVLLHTVLPGTMLSARPAALLAALSLRMGMAPLRAAADAEMVLWTERWNTVDFPETWNASCLNLLLEADADFRKRHHTSAAAAANTVNRGETGGEKKSVDQEKQQPTPSSLLKASDRRLFRALVNYVMLERNMRTTLPAIVGWTPEKTKSVTGPVVTCKRCSYKRSVTIMGDGGGQGQGQQSAGVCGICLAEDQVVPEERRKFVHSDVSPTHDESTSLCWVECSAQACRAQYVVYHEKSLNVRPKCHYCRLVGKPGTAPTVECTKCLNRVIWPKAYRASLGFDAAKYECPACTASEIKTTVEVETTPAQLAAENGTAWLLRNDGQKIPEPFNGRSMFHLVSNLKEGGTEDFAARVEVLPFASASATASGSSDKTQQTSKKSAKASSVPVPALTNRGKPIHNAPFLLTSLQTWILSRRTQSGTCTLCFSPLRKDLLRLSCGRSGCHQRICAPCHGGWYLQNRAGAILNPAALTCPFCRRLPAPSALPAAVAALGGVRDMLVDNGGGWIYAWCEACGEAKRYVERVCAAGAPAEVEGRRCGECEEAELAALVAAEEAAAAAADAAEAERLRAARVQRVRQLVRPCPGCGVATQKISGCNHITCPCGMHWCYLCGKGSIEDDPYGHIGREHGGMYDTEGFEGNFEFFVGDVPADGDESGSDYE